MPSYRDGGGIYVGYSALRYNKIAVKIIVSVEGQNSEKIFLNRGDFFCTWYCNKNMLRI